MGLKSKMAWLVAGSILLTIPLLYGVIHLSTSIYSSGYNHVRLQEISEELARTLGRMNGSNPEQLSHALQQFDSRYEGLGIELFSSDGKLLYSYSGQDVPYSLGELLSRMDNQPYRLFTGQDTTVVYRIEAGGQPYFALLHVQGEAIQEAQIFLYFSRSSPIPFLVVPVLLIILVPVAATVFFSLNVIKRLNRLSNAMQQADLQGEPPQLAVHSRDEIGKLTRLFNEMAGKLHRQYALNRAIEQARTRLISNLSHDLRTPLTIIRGYAETLQRGSAQDAQTRTRHSSIIVQRTDYMNRLLDQLFQLAELDDPLTAFQMEKCTLQHLLQNILAEYVMVLRDQGIALKVEMPEAPVQIEGDKNFLGQALRNLIDNSVQHGSDGKYLGVRLREEETWAIIEIEDRGKGIPEDEVGQVFERFYRVDKGRQGNGMGIGLSISYEIVLRHRGQISLASEPCQSTVFTVRLPLATQGGE